jgi:hypothetical protein
VASVSAFAADEFDEPAAPHTQFNYLPASNPNQTAVKAALNDGDFSTALKGWSAAYNGTAFGESQNGIGTLSYVLYKNGFAYLGLSTLLEKTQPQNLQASLLRLWHPELTSSAWVQKGWILGAGRWKPEIDNQPVHLTLKTKHDVTKAFARAQAVPSDHVNARARIWWQIATRAPQINDTASALKAVRLLKNSKQTIIGQDQLLSAEGRVLFQKGDFQAADNAYEQIPKSSTLWVQSLEERAWGDIRQDDYDKALGKSVTMLSPALVPLVGPESYFLANYLSLKACDYPRIFKNSELFKQRYRDRLGDLQDLAKTGSNKELAGILDRFDQQGVTLDAAGPQIASIPRASLHDRKFLDAMTSRRQILGEVKKASSDNQSLGLLAQWSKTGAVKSEILKREAVQRLKTLAQNELEEYRNILNKMHVIEAEVIERLHVDDSLKGQRNKLSKVEDKGDVLVFPYESDEVWFDELDNYKARVKDCPTLKGASL